MCMRNIIYNFGGYERNHNFISPFEAVGSTTFIEISKKLGLRRGIVTSLSFLFITN